MRSNLLLRVVTPWMVLAGVATEGWASAGTPGNGEGGAAAFGTSVVFVGSDLAVGRASGRRWSPRANGVHLYRQGAKGQWVEYAVLEPGDKHHDDRFGTTLGADRDWLVVGAPGAKGGGAVFVFQRKGGRWVEAGKLAVPNGGDRDQLGNALWVGDGQLIVGAPGADSSRGVVYHAVLQGDRWTGLTKIGAGQSFGDQYGSTVSRKGNRLVVGAPGGAGTGLNGYVALYRQQGSGWVDDGSIAGAVQDSIRQYGGAVALVDNEVWVGAANANMGAGVVYRYHRAGDRTWTAVGQVVGNPPPPDSTGRVMQFAQFGAALVPAGNQVFVLASYWGGRGAIMIVSKKGNDWVETGRIDPDSADAGGWSPFGNGAVAQSGDQLVVGGPGLASGVGAVYLYGRHGADWRRTGRLEDNFSLPTLVGKERTCVNGSVDGFDCNNVELMAFLPTAAIGGGRGIGLSGIWGWTDIETKREYALVGRTDGAAFVDITNPANPIYVGQVMRTPGANISPWREIKVYRNHAYIVSDGSGNHGIQVFDLTRLRNVQNAPVTFEPDVTYNSVASVHNIVIDTIAGFAYAVGSNGGGASCAGALHMIDIREPKDPKYVGCYDNKMPNGGSYIHDALCTVYNGPDTRYTGREICFNSSASAVTIVDMTDKKNPVRIAIAEYPKAAYVHQGWLTEDARYFFIDDELDEGGDPAKAPNTRTIVMDFSKLDDPVLVTEFYGSTKATDHNLYIQGRYMYLANYVAGLRVFDIQDPTKPVEVGFFDTVPWGENSAGFDGAWGNYPYFKSGMVVVSSMGQGLFILKPRLERPVQ